MFSTLDVLTSGMTAQRARLNVAADNYANIESTRDAYGNVNPYKPKRAVFRTGMPDKGMPNQGVTVSEIKEFPAFKINHIPNHPDADENGNVKFPDVDPLFEFVDAIEAARAYEMNATAFEVTKQLFSTTIRLLA